MRGLMRRVTWGICLTLIAIVLFQACGRTPRRPNAQQVREILARGAPFSESSFYACLINGYEQGLPLKQIQAECETKLGLDDTKGFGPAGRDIVGPFGRDDRWTDPSQVSGTCSSGDPRVGKGPDGTGRIKWNYADGRAIDWGQYTWGGEGECDRNGCYKGLTEEESKQQKTDAIKAANQAILDYQQKKAESEADPGDAAKKKAAEDAKAAAMKAADKAGKDPNKKDPAPPDPNRPIASADDKGPGGGARPSGEGTSCEEAVRAANDFVSECNRTGWRHTSCQQLLAKMNNCPDPTLIYVDPDAGYTCGEKIDPELVKNAWVERCRQLRRPVPGGPDPCEAPKIDDAGRFAGQGAPADYCNSPIALVDPEAPECLGTVTIQAFGQPDIQEILVWALNKLGGPIVFIPDRNPKPPPTPGPQPRPGPIP